MLHTFSFELSYNSFARALALAQNPGLSRYVRVLTFATWVDEDQARRVSFAEIEALDARHRVMTEHLSSKYGDASLTRHSIILREATYPSLEDIDNTRLLDWEHNRGPQGASYSFMDTYIVRKALTIIIGQFPNLERICMNDASYQLNVAYPMD